MVVPDYVKAQVEDSPEQANPSRPGCEEMVARLAMVAHEMRNPMNAIQLAASLLERELAEHQTLTPRLAQLIERLTRNAALTNRLIGDVLEVARVEAGSLSLRWQIVDLVTVAAAMLDALEGTSRDRVSLIAPDEVVASIDPDRITQVLANLVRNALQYGQGNVVVSLSDDPSSVTLAVANNGEIPPEVASRLFQPFVRGTSTGSGLGLGLYVAARLVGAHGGSLSFEPREGSVTFAAVLPRR